MPPTMLLQSRTIPALGVQNDHTTSSPRCRGNICRWDGDTADVGSGRRTAAGVASPVPHLECALLLRGSSVGIYSGGVLAVEAGGSSRNHATCGPEENSVRSSTHGSACLLGEPITGWFGAGRTAVLGIGIPRMCICVNGVIAA